MKEERKSALLAEFEDEFNILEQKSSFLAMATAGLGMLDDEDLQTISSASAWAGLGWYSEEIAEALRKIKAKM